MRLPTLFLAAATLAFPPLLLADPPAKVEPGLQVGSVYGKQITAADIGLTQPIDPEVQFDAREEEKWKLAGGVRKAFGKPIMDRFIKRKKIEATADEIKTFQKQMQKQSEQHLIETEERLAKVQEELKSPDLSDEEKATLEERQALLEDILPTMRESVTREAPAAMARQFIVAWKVERELHREYGGRVIFQQAGPEALDARRQLFEQAEKEGDLSFDDEGVRHLFYHYFHMEHIVGDEKTLEKPWFLGEEEE